MSTDQPAARGWQATLGGPWAVQGPVPPPEPFSSFSSCSSRSTSPRVTVFSIQ